MATGNPRPTPPGGSRDPRQREPSHPAAAAKTMRHFYCVDGLWRTFEQMAGELGCSIDYLLNEAMRAYARGKKRWPEPPTVPKPTPPPPPQPPRPLPRPVAPQPIPSQPSIPSRTGGKSLYLIFNGQPIPIAADQFVIGRTSKGCDLVIRDGNISRKHAAIIRRSGTYYIKDLGSTNGIEYESMRIDNKRIDEGDIFRICDYQLRFTYR